MLFEVMNTLSFHTFLESESGDDDEDRYDDDIAREQERYRDEGINDDRSPGGRGTIYFWHLFIVKFSIFYFIWGFACSKLMIFNQL